MNKEKRVEISVKSVFVGKENMDEIFYNLLREKCRKSVDGATNLCYNKVVGFPGVHA